VLKITQKSYGATKPGRTALPMATLGSHGHSFSNKGVIDRKFGKT
jgi:hypothetical protein